MNKFAKLYETEDIGQILVMLDQGDDGPEVKIYFTVITSYSIHYTKLYDYRTPRRWKCG